MESKANYLIGYYPALDVLDPLLKDPQTGELVASPVAISILTILYLVILGKLPRVKQSSGNAHYLDDLDNVGSVMNTSFSPAETYFKDPKICQQLLDSSKSKELLLISRHLRFACYLSTVSSDLMCAHILEICMGLIKGIAGKSVLDCTLTLKDAEDLIAIQDLYNDVARDLKIKTYSLATLSKNSALRNKLCIGSLKSLRSAVNNKDYWIRDLILYCPTYRVEAQLLANIYTVRNNLYHVDLEYSSQKYLKDYNPESVSQIFMVRELKYWLWQYIKHILQTDNTKVVSPE